MMLMPLLMSKLTNEHNARLHSLETHRSQVGNLEKLIDHLQAEFVSIKNLSAGGFEFIVQLPPAWIGKYEAIKYLIGTYGYRAPIVMPDASLLCEHENGNLLTLRQNPSLSAAAQWNATRGAH